MDKATTSTAIIIIVCLIINIILMKLKNKFSSKNNKLGKHKMCDTLKVELINETGFQDEEGFDGLGEVVKIYINNEEILDIIKKEEEPYDSRPGDYLHVSAFELYENLTDALIVGTEANKNGVEILCCTCRCPRCSSILLFVEEDDKYVYWKKFKHTHREWNYNISYKFEKTEYEKVIKQLDAWKKWWINSKNTLQHISLQDYTCSHMYFNNNRLILDMNQFLISDIHPENKMKKVCRAIKGAIELNNAIILNNAKDIDINGIYILNFDEYTINEKYRYVKISGELVDKGQHKNIDFDILFEDSMIRWNACEVSSKEQLELEKKVHQISKKSCEIIYAQKNVLVIDKYIIILDEKNKEIIAIDKIAWIDSGSDKNNPNEIRITVLTQDRKNNNFNVYNEKDVQKIKEHILRNAKFDAWDIFIQHICFKEIESLSEMQKNAVLCYWYDAEMNSGGHRGYFDVYPETNPNELAKAIRVIANDEIAENYLKAIKDGEDDDFKKTDMVYYKFSPSLSDYLQKYVEENKDLILK